jgi:hypothetical protein
MERVRISNGNMENDVPDLMGNVKLKWLTWKFSINWSKRLLQNPLRRQPLSLIVTDTLISRKESKGLVDMEEVRGIGRCRFWSHKVMETEWNRKGIRSY